MTQRPHTVLAAITGRYLLLAVGLALIVSSIFTGQDPVQQKLLGFFLLAAGVFANRLTGFELGSFKLALAPPGPGLPEQETPFKSFFVAEGDRLRRFAVLMTADEHAGASVAEKSLARTRAHWREIRANERESYAFGELLREVEGAGFLGVVAGGRKRRHATAVQSVDAEEADWLRPARVLQSLPTMVRATILLRYSEGMPESQIATIVARPARTVRADIEQGLAQLDPQVRQMVGGLA